MLKLHRKDTQEIHYHQNFETLEQRTPTLLYNLGLSVVFLLGLAFILNTLQELLPYIDNQFLEPILVATSSPFISFFIGLLLAALFQYLPFTLLLILFLVNAQLLTIYSAVYMIFGVNIGTSSTTAIVSLEYVKRKKHFKKAVSASIIQDALHIIASLFLILLDLSTNFISLSLQYLQLDYNQAPKNIFQLFPIFNFSLCHNSARLMVLFVLGWVGIWFCLHYAFYYLTQFWGNNLITELGLKSAQSDLKTIINGLKVGLLIPSNLFLAKYIIPTITNYKMRLEKVVLLLVGINIGMTVFMLSLACLYLSAENGYLVIVHVIVNLCGLIFVLVPFIKLSVAFYSKRLVKKLLKNRLIGLGYILFAFFIIPFLLILGSKDWVKVQAYYLIERPNSLILYTEQNAKTNAENKKIYYRKINKLHYDSQAVQYFLSYPLNIQKSEKFILINNQPWMLASQGYCWEDTDKIGKFITCIDSISTRKVKYNQQTRVDTIYFFSKKYISFSKKLAKNWIIKAEVDISRKIIKKYSICSHNELLYREEMISLF
ncbi:MAG: hypothetical protein NZ551_10155 [Microscillaceae bacterium]|nr:hypothetical protein [Microscillaceae bacterium]MDW8461559.1 hypothetical protein [Cytophagales bacterium]